MPAPIPANPYTPPECVPGVPFIDITCSTGFDPWIEQLGLDGLTAGCGGDKYCPSTPVTRDQMAVFIEKAIHGTSAWSPGDAGNSNTFLGASAGLNTPNGGGTDNTAIGTGSLHGNTTASKNTAVGVQALYMQSYSNSNTAYDTYNTAVGYQALYSNEPNVIGHASNNTALGSRALQANITGYRNTAIGSESLNANTTGNDNTANGDGSLQRNTTGDDNTANGALSLSYNTDGSNNTAIGLQSLYTNTTGLSNTAIGVQSLSGNTSGWFNIAIGASSGAGLTTGNYNIDIGNGGATAEANTIRIGDSHQTNSYIAGIYGVTISGGSTVLVDSNGHLGSVSSSLRFKQGVADMGDASSRLMELRPVTFHNKAYPDGPLQYGLIAEEVEQMMPELVVKDATGQPETVAYHELPAMLLNELKKQQATIQAQQARIESRDARIAALEARLEALEARLAGK